MTLILMVEDNAANAKLISGVLEAAGYDILVADSADAGIPLAKERQPALILMDIQLQGMDGLAATRILKSDEVTADIPIIAVTAHAMKGDEERILEAGCDLYLPKPIRYKELLAAVKSLLENPGD